MIRASRSYSKKMFDAGAHKLTFDGLFHDRDELLGIGNGNRSVENKIQTPTIRIEPHSDCRETREANCR